MRNRPRRLTRREKWPLQVGLFLLYVLVQTITSGLTSTAASMTRSPPISEPSLTVDASRVEPSVKELPPEVKKTQGKEGPGKAKSITENPRDNRQRETKLEAKEQEASDVQKQNVSVSLELFAFHFSPETGKFWLKTKKKM